MSNFGTKFSERFILELFSWDLLDEAVQWIGDELEPDDVFTVERLESWAFNNGFKKFE